MEAVADVCQQLFGIAPGAMLLVCLLVFLAGYVDAIAGGGGLISLPAYMIAGLPTHAAIATNKMSSTMGTTIATWHYAKSGYIQWKLAGVCVVKRSCTCGRFAYTSTRRASFDKPHTRPSAAGM